MSPPNRVPSHSSSPSKLSLRSPSGGAKSPNPRNLLPAPRFEEPLPQRPHRLSTNLNLNEQAIDEQTTSLDREGETQPRPEPEPESTPFRPFFVLLEDTVTNEHHHPTVHYIFSDDDTDIITEAACRSLAQDDPTTTSSPPPPLNISQDNPKEDENETRLPRPIPNVHEHYLLLDVEVDFSDGTTYEVTRAASMSSEWQVLNTSITNAPTIQATDAGDEGLMLKVEGRGETPENSGPGEAGGVAGVGKVVNREETLEEMVERFEKTLADIRMAIDAGGGIGTTHALGQEGEEQPS